MPEIQADAREREADGDEDQKRKGGVHECRSSTFTPTLGVAAIPDYRLSLACDAA